MAKRSSAASWILLVPPQKPPWEQNPLAPFGGVPREKREQKTEDFIVMWNMPVKVTAESFELALLG